MRRSLVLLIKAIFLIAFFHTGSEAAIDGATGNTFNLTAKAGRITTGDGNSVYAWGYADGNGPMQYPGLTMIVNEGDVVTVTLRNELPVPVSILFPGQENVTSTGGTKGVLADEAATGQSVTYSFTASRPGTYMYHSGTNPELQTEMGLVGAIVVRPRGFDHMAMKAYGHAGTSYDRETLFLLTEMDPRIHETVELKGPGAVYATDLLTNYSPYYWFINGRNAPDTMAPSNIPWMPTQPYGCMPIMHPGEKLLLRVINAGRDLHPFHPHGNHVLLIAKDGRVLESAPGNGPDLAQSVFTLQSVPGTTMDAIFEWTGKGLGWDIYGNTPHSCLDNNGDGLDDTTKEYCPDHGKPVPVILPDLGDVSAGNAYSGSPYLGSFGVLQPGQGTANPTGGYFYMWHSHTEKEMTNFDIFPGGMMTMLIIEAPSVPINSH